MTDTISRIMQIRNGMTTDADAEAIIEREIAALQPHGRSSPGSASALADEIDRALNHYLNTPPDMNGSRAIAGEILQNVLWDNKAGIVAHLRSALQPATPTIDDVPSCGQENDYRRATPDEAATPSMRDALESIAGWRKVNIQGEYEHGLRDIIRSVTDCAAAALEATPLIENVGNNAPTSDIRWAVNVLLEKIAAKFEANETIDLWRSDAAATVRSFKHDLSIDAAQPSWQPIIERLCKPESGHTIHDVVANYRAIRRDALAISSTPRHRPFCSCKASQRDGQHMAWCPAVTSTEGK